MARKLSRTSPAQRNTIIAITVIAALIFMALINTFLSRSTDRPIEERPTASRPAPPPPATQTPRPTHAPPTPHAASSPSVYIAPDSGERYHGRKNCSGLKNARRVEPTTRDRALQANLKPCGICKPQ
jgi:hypothetical protein